MSLPREVLPGQTYMVTRRCTQRQFLMRPDRDTNNAFIYCLAEAAARYRIDVLFTVAMSNHHHTGIYDREGNYPAFLEHFHKLFAKCQNALRGRWENFWSSEQTSVVRLIDPNDVFEKLIYALTNPVKDGLVDKAHHWPGVSALGALLRGTALMATRPRHFFRDDGAMPQAVTLSFSRPPGFDHLSDGEFRRLLEERILRVELCASQERSRTGRSIIGRRGILSQHWSAQPATHQSRRALDPRLAARSKWSRIEAVLRNRSFQDAYFAARASFIAGMKDVLFPSGTYWLRRFASALCAPCPSPT